MADRAIEREQRVMPLEIPALTSLGLAMAVCGVLIAWDLIQYREHRVQVRRDRP